jgi:hypothetical protein
MVSVVQYDVEASEAINGGQFHLLSAVHSPVAWMTMLGICDLTCWAGARTFDVPPSMVSFDTLRRGRW